MKKNICFYILTILNLQITNYAHTDSSCRPFLTKCKKVPKYIIKLKKKSKHLQNRAFAKINLHQQRLVKKTVTV